MVYIPVDFDIDDFLARIQGTKPPFVCPADSCQKTFKSYSYIQKHMTIHRPPAPIEIHAIPVGLNGAMHTNGKDLTACSMRTYPLSGQKENLSVPYRPPQYNDPNSFVLLEGKGNGITQSFRCSIFVPLTFHIQNLTDSGLKGIDSGKCIKIDNDNDKLTKPEQLAHRKRSFTRQKIRIKNGASNGCNLKKSASSGDYHTNVSQPTPQETCPAPPSLALPKAVFEVDSTFTLKKPVLQNEAAGYVRHIDQHADELDEVVEYDLDEEDLFWLDQVNSERRSRGLKNVSETTLEWVIDRFEKESKFRIFSADGNPIDDVPAAMGLSHSGIDEDAVCAVCQDGTCENTNVILFCDVCNLAVHQECYGVPYVPEGPWLCRKCLHSPSEPVSCVLCPNRDGAFKKTADDRWAHVICGLWVPEVMFANLTFLEPLEGIDQIAPARWRLLCFICKQRNAGACIQCHKINCYRAFHVTCAQSAGLYMKIEHSDDGDGTGSGGAGDAGIKKNAYCDQHCPPNHFKSSNKGMYANSDSESPQSPEQAARVQLRKARKVLAERRNSKPSMCVPVVPKSKFDLISSKLTADSPDLVDLSKFLAKAYAFWKLKREVRRGVPLLKRLQASSVHRNAANFVAAATTVGTAESQRMRVHLQFWQQLRQDLERARLLAELTRKRERVKRDLFQVHASSVELRIRPMSVILSRLLDQLQVLDKGHIFSEPVTAEIAPDYSQIIRNPMDFSTMRSKVDAHGYSSISDLEADFNLMLSNCRKYNRRDSIYYASAILLADKGRPVFESALLACKALGIATETDFLSASLPEDVLLPELNQPSVDSLAIKTPVCPHEDATSGKGDGKKTKEEEEGKDRAERQDVAHRPLGRRSAVPVVTSITRSRTLRGSTESRASHPIVCPSPQSTGGDSQAVLETIKTGERVDTIAASAPATEASGKSVAIGLVGRKRRRSSTSSGGTSKASPPTRRTCTTTGGDSASLLSPHTTATATTTTVEVKKPRLVVTPVEPATPRDSNLTVLSTVNKDNNNSHDGLFASVSRLRSGQSVTVARWSTPVLEECGGQSTVETRRQRTSPTVDFLSAGNLTGTEKRPAFTNYRLTKEVHRWEDEEDDEDEDDEEDSDESEQELQQELQEQRQQSRQMGGGEASTGGARRQGHQMVRSRQGHHQRPAGGESANRPTVIVTVVGKSCLAAAAATTESAARSGGKLRRPGVSRHQREQVAKACQDRRVNQPTTGEAEVAALRGREFGLRSRTTAGDKSSCSDLSAQEQPLVGSNTSTSSSHCLQAMESPAGGPLSVNTTASSSGGGTACLADPFSFETLASPITTGVSPTGQVTYLDVVWAKCRGSPWYPGLVVDPEAGDGYCHNGVPIPVPPASVLEWGRKLGPASLGSIDAGGVGVQQQLLLVLFFDAKRTWQWLPSHKLELLGCQTDLDKLHLAEAKRSKMRHAVIKAYHRAIEHLCKVHGRPYPYTESKDSNVTFTL